MTQRNQQHTDLNSENRLETKAGLREGFNGASLDPAVFQHNTATPSAAALLARTVASEASVYSLSARTEEERERFEKQLDRAILSAQNINENLSEQHLREINQRIDANLDRFCTSFRNEAQMAAMNVNLGNGLYQRLNGNAFAGLSLAAEQGGELREMRKEMTKLDEKAAALQEKLSETANDLTAHNDRMTRDMADSHRTYREMIRAYKDITTNENGILAELGLTRADIDRFTYSAPNSGEFEDGLIAHRGAPFNTHGHGINASLGSRTWYDIQLTGKDGEPIPLTDEQKNLLRESLQEKDAAHDIYEMARRNSLNSQFYADEMRKKMDALLEERQQLNEDRAILRQEIKESAYLSAQFGSYGQGDDARMTDEQQAFNNIREKMGIVHLTETYARYRNDNPPPIPNEGEEWTPAPREGYLQAFFDKNPEAAAGYMIMMRAEYPETAASIAEKHPEFIAQIDRQIEISTHGISDEQVVDFIVETQAGQEPSATQENAQENAQPAAQHTSTLQPITPSGIEAGVDPNRAFAIAASGEEAAPRAPDMPAPRPQEQPMAAMM